MESTFTKFPEPVADTETSWKDNVEWQAEYQKQWKGDPKLELPARRLKTRFAHVPDLKDPDFDPSNAESFVRAKEQRYRERFVAIAEMKLLQQELRVCFAQNTMNAARLCRPLALEYLRRWKCPFYVCDSKERPVLLVSSAPTYGQVHTKVLPKYGQGQVHPMEGD